LDAEARVQMLGGFEHRLIARGRRRAPEMDAAAVAHDARVEPLVDEFDLEAEPIPVVRE